MIARFMAEAVLFDLDGTLADTAPDLGGAVNRMRERRGLAPLPIERLRPVASAGTPSNSRLSRSSAAAYSSRNSSRKPS